MSALETRLARQLAAKGVDNAKGTAHGILVKRGDIQPDGDLTAHGKVRDALGPAGRAKDRASKASGKPAADYNYNPKTNQATLKKGLVPPKGQKK